MDSVKLNDWLQAAVLFGVSDLLRFVSLKMKEGRNNQ